MVIPMKKVKTKEIVIPSSGKIRYGYPIPDKVEYFVNGLTPEMRKGIRHSLRFRETVTANEIFEYLQRKFKVSNRSRTYLLPTIHTLIGSFHYFEPTEEYQLHGQKRRNGRIVKQGQQNLVYRKLPGVTQTSTWWGECSKMGVHPACPFLLFINALMENSND